MSSKLSSRTLIAVYFALCAGRKGRTKVVISNQYLEDYFIGNRKGERLSEKRLTTFADTLKPIFPRSIVKRSQLGPKLILCLNDQPDSSPATPVWFVDEASILKALGMPEKP